MWEGQSAKNHNRDIYYCPNVHPQRARGLWSHAADGMFRPSAVPVALCDLRTIVRLSYMKPSSYAQLRNSRGLTEILPKDDHLDVFTWCKG